MRQECGLARSQCMKEWELSPPALTRVLVYSHMTKRNVLSYKSTPRLAVVALNGRRTSVKLYVFSDYVTAPKMFHFPYEGSDHTV